MQFQSSVHRKQGGTLLPCCESLRQEAEGKLKRSSSQKHGPWTSGISIPLADTQMLRLPQTQAPAVSEQNRAKLVLTGPASAVSQPLPQTNHRSSERWAEWVPFLKSNFLNQVTFIQIRDTLKTQNVRMSTAKSKFSQVSLGTINVSSIFLALLSFFSIYIQWAIPPLLLPKCLIPISPMKIYTPKYPDICPLFQICSNHWYYWYSTHPYSPKHLTPPPLSILRHSHLRLTPSLGHSLPRCSSVPPATVSRAIEDSNLSASQPLAEYSSVASTYRSNLFRPSSLSHHPSTILEANITPLNGLHFVLLSNLSP